MSLRNGDLLTAIVEVLVEIMRLRDYEISVEVVDLTVDERLAQVGQKPADPRFWIIQIDREHLESADTEELVNTVVHEMTHIVLGPFSCQHTNDLRFLSEKDRERVAEQIFNVNENVTNQIVRILEPLVWPIVEQRLKSKKEKKGRRGKGSRAR